MARKSKLTQKANLQGDRSGSISSGRAKKLRRVSGERIKAAGLNRDQMKGITGKSTTRGAARDLRGLIGKGVETGLTINGRNELNAKRNATLALAAMSAG